jgi:hypothetical protein
MSDTASNNPLILRPNEIEPFDRGTSGAHHGDSPLAQGLTGKQCGGALYLYANDNNGWLPGARSGRPGSPCGRSIFATSAPISASVCAANGPARTRDRSTTRTPSSIPSTRTSPVLQQGQHVDRDASVEDDSLTTHGGQRARTRVR